MAKTNSTKRVAGKNEKLNSVKEQPVKKEGSTMVAKAIEGTKSAVSIAGDTIQNLAKAGGIWIIGGFVAVMASQFLGLGLIGTFIALAAVYLVVEGLKFAFSSEYSLKRKELKAKTSNLVDKVPFRKTAVAA